MSPETLQNRLSKLQSADDLRALFADLSYDADFSPVFLPSETKGDFAASEALAAPPQILSQSGDFKIIYAPLLDWKRALSSERLVISRLQNNFPRALWVFSDEAGQNWHLVNVKTAGKDVERDGVVIKRRSILRRISLQNGRRPGRTICERLLRLDLAQISPSLFGVTDLQIQAAHDAAFDVEGITATFFRGYRSVLGSLQKTLTPHFGDRQTAHEAALQTLNRLMFLRFLEHKSTRRDTDEAETYWLGDDPDFTFNLWRQYKSGGANDGFAAKWLEPLFFEAFNHPFPNAHKFAHLPPDVRTAFIKAPYLNGGLFRANPLDAHNDKIPDSFFALLFDKFGGKEPGFFEQFNFTISEDTPFDQEVAVDPEMIGHVYESLINLSEIEGEETDEAVSDARGDHGIFYTQRIEIDLMGRLVLGDYLFNHLSKNDKRRDARELILNWLFAYEDAEKLAADAAIAGAGWWDEINSLLRRISICDPACGSGAFLVGMLSICDDLQKRANSQLGFAETDYERAKRIIEESLYGVDVMPWAVHVAELRLWLQLVIENKLHPSQLKGAFPLLPNLGFKIRQGDSLVQSLGGETFGSVDKLRFPVSLRGQLTLLKGKKRAFFNGSQGESISKEEIERDEKRLFDDALVERRQILNRDIADLQKLQTDRDLMGDLQHGPKSQKEFSAEILKKTAQIEQAEAARQELRGLARPPFVWGLGFFEVFEGRADKAQRGFDIVIGNPPYVRQEKIAPPFLREENFAVAEWKKHKDAYKAELQRGVQDAWPLFFEGGKRKLDGKSDLYIYFFLHGLKLLSRDGAFAFITSNSWLDVGYGAELQEWLLRFGTTRTIFDNEVKRSFKSADVNTAVAILGRGGDDEKENQKQIARFVMWRVPFESATNALLWSEIEDATQRCIRAEFRLRVFEGGELWKDGADPDKPAVYTGNKWGGKFLRAPEIYDVILEKGKDKLVRLGSVADVRRGFTTGANEFFYLDADKAATWGIEKEFLRPVIKSPRDYYGISIGGSEVLMFWCRKTKDELQGTGALKYIEWGENQGFPDIPSLKPRKPWFRLNGPETPNLLWPSAFFERHIVYQCPPNYVADKVFYTISGDLPKATKAFLNSTIVSLCVEVEGYQLNHGGIFATTEWLNALPVWAQPDAELEAAYDELTQRPIELCSRELKKADRARLDWRVLQLLGFESKEALTELHSETARYVSGRIHKSGRAITQAGREE